MGDRKIRLAADDYGLSGNIPNSRFLNQFDFSFQLSAFCFPKIVPATGEKVHFLSIGNDTHFCQKRVVVSFKQHILT